MPGLSWYSKKVADNIRGHRQFLMTPTAFIPPIPLQIMPKIPQILLI